MSIFVPIEKIKIDKVNADCLFQRTVIFAGFELTCDNAAHIVQSSGNHVIAVNHLHFNIDKYVVVRYCENIHNGILVVLVTPVNIGIGDCDIDNLLSVRQRNN